jgi:hypothetical protein
MVSKAKLEYGEEHTAIATRRVAETEQSRREESPGAGMIAAAASLPFFAKTENRSQTAASLWIHRCSSWW